jgi:7-cyano-7-deazaguanine synthase in queuosine biosynthesis
LDCVCLFSGGLDSTIGAIDLLTEGRKPLLVSHAYKGDKIRQDAIATHLKGRYSKFSVNAHPLSFSGETDTSMRTRSINFLAFAAVGGCATQIINQIPSIELFVPENGFISLNTPLTTRRIGSLSTRTSHPHFMSLIQEIFDSVGIHSRIINPYQFHTKGEMVLSCKDQALLDSVFENTISCSHWKRSNQQCGSCIPCIIRRASLKKGGFNEQTMYRFDELDSVLSSVDSRDDLLALSIAISQVKNRPIGPWILDSGPLPPQNFDQFKSVFVRGLHEVETFLNKEGVL